MKHGAIAALVLLTGLAACGTTAKNAPLAIPEMTADTGNGQQLRFPFNGYQLVLREEQGGCLLNYTDSSGRSSRLDLALKGPCNFVRDHRGHPLSHRYPDAGDTIVLVAVGEIQQGCGPAARGLLINNAGFSLSPRDARGYQKCPASGMDEKEFWLFAHP